MTRTYDVAVVGAGAIGCAVARRAARDGMRVLVVDRARPGAEASSAAAGMLSPQAEAHGPGPFLDLLLRAREGFPAFARAMREETGTDLGYNDAGTLYVALSEGDEAELEGRYAWQRAAGLAVERMEGGDARAMEPALSPAVRMALRFPGDHQVENRAMATALWSAAARAGAEFRIGAQAAALLRDGDHATGLLLAGGERISAGHVVLAAGAWSGQMGWLPRALPVEPVHGQLLSLEAVPPVFRHVVDSPRAYLVPRGDGRVIVGATAERVGFRKAVTPRGLRALIDGAVEIAPVLEGLPLRETWSGFRPGTPDGLPVLGVDPDVPSLVYATGHYRNGVLLAPLTGELVGSVLRGETPEIDLAPYAADRFAGAEEHASV